MIRRSSAIATAAILLSLLVHFIGLSFTSRLRPEHTTQDATPDVVAMGNAFEDVAENLPEPAPPENTPDPEPPTAPVPEPEVAETPTSEALVASANPQHTVSPDTGSAKVVQPDTAGPSELRKTGVPESATLEPSGGDDGAAAEAAVTRPVEPDAIAQAPKGGPDATAAPVETAAAVPVVTPPITPAPQQLAAVPVPAAPALPVTPAPEPLAVPAIRAEPETVDPESPETAVAPRLENSDAMNTDVNADASDLAVASSPRPRLRNRRPPAEPVGQTDGSTGESDFRIDPSLLIESPLAAYRRDGTDLFARQSGGDQSGGVGALEARGPGNSTVTNYAGQVLVHLNRAAAVHVSARGSARVFFEINPDGSLAWVDIIESTGSQEVESAAKAQVRSAAPFPRPPKGGSRRLAFVYRSN